MAAEDAEKLVRALFAAYLADNRAAVEAMLSADFRFTSPYDDEIDKATYFERCWRGSDWIESHEIERICATEDGVFVTYRCVAKGGKSFCNTEFMRLTGHKISHIDVYFGATYQDGVFMRSQG